MSIEAFSMSESSMSIEAFSSPMRPGFTRIVNADNLEDEFVLIGSLIDDCPFVSLYTAFSGVVSLPPKFDNDRQNSFHLYDNLKRTVDDYKAVQLGLTLADGKGNLYVWGFNFKDFDPARDAHDAEWIESLKQKGVDLQKNREHGIESQKFAELMMPSGLVLNEEVTWMTFHSAYDFGFLLKMLTGKPLPNNLPQFLQNVKTFFGANAYDLKHLMKHCKGLHGGLEKVAKTLKAEVEPSAGEDHHAGANSLLTWNTFQKMKDLCCVDLEKLGGVLYGLEAPF